MTRVLGSGLGQGRGSSRAVLALLVAGTALAAWAEEPSAKPHAEEPSYGTSAEVELGRRLFFETELSISGVRSCATCHDPDHGFSDAVSLSRDEVGFSFRHAQTLVDMNGRKGRHWNDDLEDVEELVRKRIHGWFWGQKVGPFRAIRPDDPDARLLWRDLQVVWRETSMGREADTLRLALRIGGFGGFNYSDPGANLEVSGRYREAFAAANGSTSSTVERMGSALAAYLRTLRTSRSPLDRFLGGEEGALSPAARRGLDLFRGKARCAECHQLEPERGRPPLTDRDFHNTGVAWKAEQARLRAGIPDLLLFMDHGLALQSPEGMGDTGRGSLSLGKRFERAFRTPTLRDVGRRGPFMHDGSIATLADVVNHYTTGTGGDELRDKRVRGFESTELERADLVAFLESLSGDVRPGLAREAWSRRARLTRLTFLDADRKPMVDFAVEVVPDGDVLPGATGQEAPLRLRTDRRGRLSFAPFARTHARLVLPDDLTPQHGALIPDTCAEAEIVCPVEGRGGIAVTFAPGRAAPPTLSAAHLGRTVVRDWPASVRRSLSAGLFVDRRSSFRRLSMTTVDAKDVAVYEGWVRTDLGPVILLLFPGEADPRLVVLRPGETVHVDATRAPPP